MAVYEYKCILCEREFEIKKSMYEIDRYEYCEYCGSQAERKFPSKTGGAVLLGNGWHKSDYKKKEKIHNER